MTAYREYNITINIIYLQHNIYNIILTHVCYLLYSEQDPMQLLPHTDSWIVNVDCLCARTIKESSERCDVCQANGFDADDISNSPKKISRKRKSRGANDVGDSDVPKRRSGRKRS